MTQDVAPLSPEEEVELRALDAAWEPGCQFIKANAETAKGHGQYGVQHPWPMTVAQAAGYYKLCRGRERDLPHRFVGPEWDHDTFVYDLAQDTDPRAERRRFLATLDAVRAERDEAQMEFADCLEARAALGASDE